MIQFKFFFGIGFALLAIFTLFLYLLNVNFPISIIGIQIFLAFVTLIRTKYTWWIALGLYTLLLYEMLYGTLNSSSLYDITSFLFPISYFLNFEKGELAIVELVLILILFVFHLTKKTLKSYSVINE